MNEPAYNSGMLSIFRQAKEKISKGRCKGAAALDDRNHMVAADSPSAVKWCLSGSITGSGGSILEIRYVRQFLDVQEKIALGY